MNQNDKVDTISIAFDEIKPLEFNWLNDTATMAGVTANSVNTVTLGAVGSSFTNATTNTGYISIGASTGTYDDFGPTRKEHNEVIERIAKLEAIMAQEAEIRANHPAVKNAYDEYRLLLALAK